MLLLVLGASPLLRAAQSSAARRRSAVGPKINYDAHEAITKSDGTGHRKTTKLAHTAVQVRDFATEVVGKPIFLVCNSVGGVAGLQAGVDAPEQVRSAG